MTTTMLSPPSESMRTTPGRASRNEFDFMGRRILLYVRSIIGYLEAASFCLSIENFGKKALPPRKVMSVGLSIGGQMNKPFSPL